MWENKTCIGGGGSTYGIATQGSDQNESVKEFICANGLIILSMLQTPIGSIIKAP